MENRAIIAILVDDMARALVRSSVDLEDEKAVEDVLRPVRFNGSDVLVYKAMIVDRAFDHWTPPPPALPTRKLSDDELVPAVRELRSFGLDQVTIASVLGVNVRKVSPIVKDMPIRRGPATGDKLLPGPDRLEVAYRQWQDGERIPVIAEGLGVSAGTVRRLCGHLPRGKRCRLPEGWLEKAQRLWVENVKPEAIASEVGTSVSAVRKHCGHLPRHLPPTRAPSRPA